MPIPTSRTNENGKIEINHKTCTGCGLCVKVCKDFSLEIKNGKVQPSLNSVFGCIACGHCMAICPSNSISISGRDITAEDLINLDHPNRSINYDSLLILLKHRRSIREFTQQEVEEENIAKILEAAKTAPMGLPPSDVNVMIIKGREANHQFAMDFCDYLLSKKWMISPLFLFIMRPIWGKANDRIFRGFVKPLLHLFIKSKQENVNLVTYDAPLAMYFYGTPFCDPADPIVAATYAMLAGESLGLGTCMLGAVHLLIQNGKKAEIFRKKYGIKFKSREGLIVIFGYPDVHYKKGLKRKFASINTIS